MKNLIFLFLPFCIGCGLRSIPQAKNNVAAKLAEINNQYQRRSDLIPNLVKTVKGYAKHETETLNQVIQARSQATNIKLDASDLTPEKLKTFQQAQGKLSSAIGRLLMISERYPDLKASQNFLALQSQLEGTENRIAVARKRYIESIQHFNNLVTVPPESWTNGLMYKHTPLPQLEVSEEKKELPEINF